MLKKKREGDGFCPAPELPGFWLFREEVLEEDECHDPTCLGCGCIEKIRALLLYTCCGV
jgi:hypothetical protein